MVLFAECASCVRTFSRELFDLEYDSKIIVNFVGQLSTIPCLGTRFVAYLAVLAGVIGGSVKVCEGVKFHRLPQDPDQRYRWLVSIKKPISGSENTRICSLHFESSEGTINALIPTIFPWSIPVKSQHPPAIRNPIPPKKRKLEESTTPSKVAKREIEIHEERIAQLEEKVLRLEEESAFLPKTI